ncbi:MAG: hypothetical protein J6W45_10110 [Bacteroidales bacterium]|nr:hypothetical protein [Bacteroidales bacterium]
MPKKLKQTCLWLFLLALVACGTTRQAAQPMWTTTVTTVTLADSLWTFSKTHPDGFTLNISTWEMPTEGIAVAYSATQDRHDRDGLEFVVSHARTHGGYIGGWLDTETGRYYFDSVRVFPEDSLTQASQFGRENAQIAIYILSSDKEIRLED